MKKDPARLRAVLIGYLSKMDEIDRAIAEIRRRMGKAKAGSTASLRPQRGQERRAQR
jgi:hypothetical protein